jgi:hypothetical protein
LSTGNEWENISFLVYWDALQLKSCQKHLSGLKH